jgi:DNA-binding FadR family transcriptional regulator
MRMPPTKRDQEDEARRKAAQRAPIQTRGLPVPDLPKNIVANELLDRIKRGIFQPGEQVPSIAEVMTMANVAKNTARSALDQLRDANYIKTLTGFGSFVNPPEMWNKSPDE